PVRHAAIDHEVDLQLLRVFRAAGDQRQAALRTEAFGFRQFDGFLADGQVAVVPALGTRPAALVTAGPGWRRLDWVVQLIRAILARLLLRGASELLGSELAVLPAQLIDFLFQLSQAPAGLGVHGLPVAGLLPQFQILPAQPGDFRTQRLHVLVKAREQRHRRRQGVRVRARVDEQPFHDRIVLGKRRGGWTEQLEREGTNTTGWTNLYRRRVYS